MPGWNPTLNNKIWGERAQRGLITRRNFGEENTRHPSKSMGGLRLVAIVVLNAIGLSLFTAGFFFIRIELEHHSSCDDFQSGGFDFTPRALHQHYHQVDSGGAYVETMGEGNAEKEELLLASLPSSECWVDRQYSKVVFILIDALRFDFVDFNETLASAARPPGSSSDASFKSNNQNRLPALNNLLRKRPKYSKLFRFIADAPTVTMQVLTKHTSVIYIMHEYVYVRMIV